MLTPIDRILLLIPYNPTHRISVLVYRRKLEAGQNPSKPFAHSQRHTN
jgi:hypothetical protein